jgi:catalase
MKPNATTGGAKSSKETPAQGLVRLFISDQVKRIVDGQCPVRRATFFKPHGSAYGSFTVMPKLRRELRVGVFAHQRFDAWVRFSSDTLPVTPDAKTTCGLAIKLFGVPGRKLLEPNALTQDFVMQNFPVFFVDDAKAMFEVSDNFDAFVKKHPETKKLSDAMSHPVDSVARIDYWSALASKLGPKHVVKYKLVAGENGGPSISVDKTYQDYLGNDLAYRLLHHELRFTFCVQLQTDPKSMPVDQGTVEWSEAKSPPIPVATLVLPRQDINATGQTAYAENLSFSPWHSLPEHEPVGSIQQARKVVYRMSSEVRHWANGMPVVEPLVPHPTTSPFPFPPSS